MFNCPLPWNTSVLTYVVGFDGAFTANDESRNAKFCKNNNITKLSTNGYYVINTALWTRWNDVIFKLSE